MSRDHIEAIQRAAAISIPDQIRRDVDIAFDGECLSISVKETRIYHKLRDACGDFTTSSSHTGNFKLNRIELDAMLSTLGYVRKEQP